MLIKKKIISKLRILNKIPFHLFMVFLILFFLLLFQFGNDFTYYPKFDRSNLHLLCLDKVSSRTLYYQEIRCIQGPFLYLFGYLLREISPINFNFLVIVLSLLLYTFSFLFIYKIIKREINGGYFNYLLCLFLFLVFIFIYFDESFEFVALLALFLFLWGFYLLFYSKLKYNYIWGWLLLTFSFLTKQTYVFPISIAFVFYLVKILKLKIKNRFIFETKNMYKIIIPILIIVSLVAIFNLVFPNFLIYTFNMGKSFSDSPSNELGISLFSDGISGIIPNLISILKLQSQKVIIFLIVTFLLSSYRLIKKKDFIASYVFFSISSISFLNLFILGNNILEYKRILFITPFFIILVLKLNKSTKKNYIGKVLLILTMLFLIYPAFKMVLLNNQVLELEKDVGSVIEHIPKQEYILTEKNRFKFYEGIDYNVDVIKNLPFGDYDPYVVFPLEKAGLFNLSKWESREAEKKFFFYSPFIKNIIEGRYSLIIYKPIPDGIVVDKTIRFIRELSRANNISFNQIFPMKCYTYIPTLEDRCPNCYFMLTLYFSNISHCNLMRNKLLSYYNEHFDKICNTDRHAADFVKSTMFQNGIKFNKVCESGGNLLENYSNKRKIQIKDLYIILLTSIAIISFYLSKSEKRKLFFIQLKESYKKNKKFLFVVFIIMLLISLVFLYNRILYVCDKPYIAQNGKCCLDKNEDKICDEEENKTLKECLLNETSNKIVLGKSCSTIYDCMVYAEQMDIPKEYLIPENFECEKSFYMDMPDLLPCTTKQDCLDSIESNTDLSSVIRCGKFGFCQMGKFSSRIYIFLKEDK